MGEEFIRLTIEKCKVYKRNGYYLCISDLQHDNYQLFIGFSGKDLNVLSKEEIVSEIRKVSDLVNSINQSGIYVLPIISPYELEQAALENDDKKFYEIMSMRIQPITRDIYEILRSNNKNLESVIRMIKQNSSDRKFIDWMDMKLMESGIDYVYDIEYSKLKEEYDKKSKIGHDMSASFQNMNSTPIVRENNQTNLQRIAPIDRTYENTLTNTKSNKLVRRLVKPNNQGVSPGFSNITFVFVVLTIAIIFGVGIGYLIIK